MKLRARFPNNGLIKSLSSTIGYLTKSNTRQVTYDQIQSENLDIGFDETCQYKLLDHKIISDTNEYFAIQDVQNPYKYNIRIKAFLPAAARVKVAEVVMENFDKCIRVHTDNATFTEPLPAGWSSKYKRLLREKKTSGRIFWRNMKSYYPVPPNYTSFDADEYEDY